MHFNPPYDMDLDKVVKDGTCTIELKLGQYELSVDSTEPFNLPKVASTQEVYAWKGKGEFGHEYEVEIMFLGPGYLMLWVPWQMLFVNVRDGSFPPRPPNCPEQFQFYGLRRDLAFPEWYTLNGIRRCQDRK